MIESIADLNLKDFDIRKEESEDVFWGKVDAMLQEKLNLSLNALQSAIGNATAKKAEELTLDLPNLAPYNDYGKLIESNDEMAIFLKEEASKPENWILDRISEDPSNTTLIRFEFACKAVDDTNVLIGTVFTNKSGIIRHCYPQIDL